MKVNSSDSPQGMAFRSFPSSLVPRIVYEDTHLIVLSKPAGLLSQGETKGAPNLVDWLRGYLGRYYVGLIHRLDRNVSGLMVVAKRTKAAARLTRSLQEGTLIREYQAWVAGRLLSSKVWRHFLAKDPKSNVVSAVKEGTRGSKESVLSVWPLRGVTKGGRAMTLVQFRLETGRSHQIRVQSAAEGYPVAGDRKYGGGKKSALRNRLALHSAVLKFPHPMTGEKMDFKEPLDLVLNESMIA